MIKTYLKESQIFKAIQFLGDENLQECLKFLEEKKPGGDDSRIITIDDQQFHKGDVIVKNTNEECFFFSITVEELEKEYYLIEE